MMETLPYPEILPRLYREWQRCYVSYYKTKSLRGRLAGSGSLQSNNEDWQSKLAKAEAMLLVEFHRWLRNLHQIQAEIARIPPDEDATSESNQSFKTQLFITCIAPDLTLERLPWETWRVMTPTDRTIQILRTPAQWQRSPKQQIRRGGKPRILAILGDDTNLTLEKDRTVLRSLNAVADVEWMSWQTLPNLDLLRAQICQKLADPQGWDVLFFAGHSQESTSVGGELAISPGVSLSIREMTPALQQAQAQGLRLAIFNSCNGLGIALELISLGLSQVIAMREPIDNAVAQIFLAQFVAELRAYRSVDDALLETRKYLKEREIFHPSTFLIPSLYCHPDADLFQFQPWGIWQRLRQWQPSHLEVKLVGVCLGLSLLPPVQTTLLDGRLFTQLLWREIVSSPAETPPQQVVVEIDDDSLLAAQVNSLRPLDRSYLARLVNYLVRQKSQVIGVDYIFDYQTANDLALKKAFKTAVDKQQTWLVFAALLNEDGREIGINGKSEVASLNWSLQGDVKGYFPYSMRILPPGGNCQEVCPFSTLLATIHQFDRASYLPTRVKPSLQSKSNLRDRVVAAIETSDRGSILKKTIQSSLKFDFLGMMNPINDFSISSERVYTKISAGCLVDRDNVLNKCPDLPDFEGKIVIIVAGEYPGSGADGFGDSDPAPLAFRYKNDKARINRGEVHSYMVSQLLNRHFVMPVPDILGVLLAALLAQILVVLLRSRKIKGLTDSVLPVQRLKKRGSQRQRSLIVALLIGDIVYLAIVLQIYVSAAILLPWLLPVLTLNSYISIARRK